MAEHGLRERKKEQTKARLMAAAVRLLEERGYEGATVELIAAEAEVSVPTFFRYFESKEDAFLASSRAQLDQVEARILARPPGVPFLEVLRSVIGEVLAGDVPDKIAMKRFHSVPQLQDKMREYEDRIRRLVTEALAEDIGVEATDLRPQMVAGCIEGAFGAARRAWLEGSRDESLADCADRALDLVEQMAEPLLKESRKRDAHEPRSDPRRT